MFYSPIARVHGPRYSILFVWQLSIPAQGHLLPPLLFTMNRG